MTDDIGVPLKEFAKGRTQPEMAAALGVTQSAVSQMVHSNRDIRVRETTKGRYEAFEIRPIGSRRKKAG
ncbi:Cro/CI family transcriptional regulator [Pseudomonas sp. LFM046]|uniref:Cro/CI family transcriptional regulator n=1 Tax=Pseudomonas sp. LFM046 TaxID=1608357 RepID=UPI0005CFE4B3|nr:Cro/CI family transcriptional regulator [Pseudomonas sp. LFM046]